MMINETIAEKESDAWMMRLARTMRRMAERAEWYYILRGCSGLFDGNGTWPG
jgi:cobyrinic acid a,c-diamide synthase